MAKAKKISRDEARRRKHLRSRSFDMTVTRRRDKHYDEVEHKKRIVDVFDQQRQQRASSDSHSRPGSRRASVSHNQEEQKEVMKSAVGIFKQRGSDVAARRRSASDQQRQLALANQKSNNNNPKNNRYRLRRMSTGSVGRDIDSLGGAGGRSAGLRGQRRRGDSNGSSPMSSLDRGETTSEGDRSPSEARLHRKVPLGEKRGSGSRSGSDDDERKSPDRRKKKLSARYCTSVFRPSSIQCGFQCFSSLIFGGDYSSEGWMWGRVWQGAPVGSHSLSSHMFAFLSQDTRHSKWVLV